MREADDVCAAVAAAEHAVTDAVALPVVCVRTLTSRTAATPDTHTVSHTLRFTPQTELAAGTAYQASLVCDLPPQSLYWAPHNSADAANSRYDPRRCAVEMECTWLFYTAVPPPMLHGMAAEPPGSRCETCGSSNVASDCVCNGSIGAHIRDFDAQSAPVGDFSMLMY
jgi:hypothetical protein